ncbi:PP2C family protein-serine/threonine phosphatase, partial [Candidatus Omnitrophota bacterium]
MKINRIIRKIPKHHLDEFLKEQTALIKRRTQLAASLFIITFFSGSLINSLALKEGFSRQLILTWIFTACVSSVMFVLSGKASTIRQAKAGAALLIVMCVAVLARHYIAISEPPFNAGMTFIFAFLGFSLMFPWSPEGVLGVLLLHLGAYSVYLFNIQTYIHKNMTFTRELPDYLQGFIVMSLSFLFCYVVTKSERKRETENFVLLKEIEEKNAQAQKELELATRVHSRLIPHSTSTNLADIAVTYVPMYYIGGDYAKFYLVDKNRLIFIICDVTGHGVSAALLVNALNVEFERLAKEGRSPGDL